MDAEPPPPFVLPDLGTVLITGGCGFLGSHIVSLLLAKSGRGTSIHVLDIRGPRESVDNVTYHTGDISSAASIRPIFESVKPDVIIHTASPNGIGSGQKFRDLLRRINVEGTKILLEESKRTGVKAFVYTSSASVITDAGRTDLINADERWPLVRGKLQPEYYSDTKAEAEATTLAASTRALPAPFLTTAIRPASIFGEQDVQFIPNLLKVARAGQTKFQLGANDNLFDVTYVGNIAQAHLLAVVKLLELHKNLTTGKEKPEDRNDDAPNVDGEAFVITNGSPVYFWDFSRAVWQAYFELSPASAHVPSPATIDSVWALSKDLAIVISTIGVWFNWLMRRPDPTLVPARVRYACMTRYFRTSKAEAALGYVPAFTLDEAVKRTVQWFVDRETEDLIKAGGAGKKER